MLGVYSVISVLYTYKSKKCINVWRVGEYMKVRGFLPDWLKGRRTRHCAVHMRSTQIYKSAHQIC